MANLTSVEAAFAAYAKLSSEEKKEFRAMVTGYEIRAQGQANAGRKAAITKKAKAATPGAETGSCGCSTA
jgi:hypothetical protein